MDKRPIGYDYILQSKLLKNQDFNNANIGRFENMFRIRRYCKNGVDGKSPKVWPNEIIKHSSPTQH